MARLVLGVVGHVDHGKTSLVRALTGMDTDRLPEEKRRGLSIALGFAHADLGGTVDFVDAPGHERFVRTLVGGITGADAVLLVVDAGEGPRPQTREHLTIAALLGVREALVAITKADLADEARLAAVGTEAAQAAAAAGLAASPPIAVSALTGAGLDRLRLAIAQLVRRRPSASDDGFAYLPVDRAFTVAGQGVVVTGTLRRGRLAVGDTLDLLPKSAPVRVRGLQAHGAPIGVAEPGQRVAINLRGATVEDLPRGVVLASAGVLAPSAWLTVSLRAAADAPRLANGARADLLIGTAQVPARVRLLDREGLDPGADCIAQVHTHHPIAAPAGDGFVLRAASPPASLAGGRVIDPESRRLRRFEAARLVRLEALAQADGAARVSLILADSGSRGVWLPRLARLAGLSPARALADAPAVRLKGDILMARPALARAQGQVLAGLESLGGSVGREGLARSLPRIGPQVLDAVVAALAAAGRVRLDAGRVSLVRASEDKARADAEAALARDLAETLRQGALCPPDLLTEGRTADARRALASLVRGGLAIRAPDKVQKREILFHRDAVDAARRRLAVLLAEPPGLTVGEIGQALGISRKFSVPLLEHLDAVHFTRRLGDRRILASVPTGAQHEKI